MRSLNRLDNTAPYNFRELFYAFFNAANLLQSYSDVGLCQLERKFVNSMAYFRSSV